MDAFVHNSNMFFQQIQGTNSHITLVTVVRECVRFHVALQVHLDQESFSTHVTSMGPYVQMPINMCFVNRFVSETVSTMCTYPLCLQHVYFPNMGVFVGICREHHVALLTLYRLFCMDILFVQASIPWGVKDHRALRANVFLA